MHVFLAIDSSGDNPQLTFKPQKEEKIISADKWTKAFHICMSFYTLKFPQEAPNLLKYCDVVRELPGKRLICVIFL